MKTTYMKHLVLITVSICLFFSVAFSLPYSSAIQYTKKPGPSIAVKKTLKTKKYKIKLFPSAAQDVLFFNAVGLAGKIYQLYVFDMGGQLVKQAQIKNRETTLLTDFTKGDYLFQIFSNDDQIENGTIYIR
jgi:hypothetical protein